MKKIFIVLLSLIVLSGCGEKSNAKYKVGVIQLVQHEALDNATKGFKDALEEEFDDEVYVDVEVASGDSATCALYANNFVADNVDLIMCNATPALQVASKATSTIPILGTSVTEYGVALGIKDFNGLVGTNVSGTSDLAPLDKQADMILELIPDCKKVGLLYCSSEDNSKYQIDVVQKYLNSKGVDNEVYSFADANLLDSVVSKACSEVDVLYVPTDNTCADNGMIIANAASVNNIPIITGEKSTLLSCEGVATLTIDYYELGRTTGKMAIEILKGESKIEEMKIRYYENPVKLYSEKQANKFGVNIPSDYTKCED